VFESLFEVALRRASALIGLVAAVAAAALVASLPAPAAASGLASANCQLAGPYKHVIYIQYDNTHLSRDNPNVPSDLEQVPALKNFLAGNGTLSSNEHTPLIAHTAGDIVTSLTGLYPDRNGIAVSNSYLQYAPNSGQLQKTPSGGFFSPSAFTYWTDPVSSSSINSPGDPLPNLITDNQQNTPAPWVPFTRAGCDVGAFSIADMELENTGTDITSVFGAASPQKQFTGAQTTSAGRNLAAADFEGIAIHCAQADSGTSGLCSPHNGGVADSLPAEPGGYSGYSGLFGAIYANQVTSSPGSFVSSTQDANGQANGNVDDLAPPVKDVYNYSSKGCQFCANGSNVGYNGQPITSNVIVDGSGNSGFVSGFSPTPAQTLGYVASMQEAGVPVTFAYIEDAHNNWNPPFQAFGPGQPQYVDQLKQENQAYQAFFERLAADGINKSNTLFVFTSDEGDHFAGISNPTPAGCNGVTTPCDYGTNGVGEETTNINNALATELGDTNPFDIHFDDAPNFYVHGATGATAPPGPNDASVRQLEQDVGKLTLIDQRTGLSVPATQHIADAVDQSILHMQTTDPLRTPTFTDFGNPTFFFQTGSCPSGTTPGCPVVGPAFAWNHGGDQPEVDTTWLGMVGPTVKKLGQTGAVWSDHTDIRPTMLSMLGLGSDYQQDGGAVANLFVPKFLPQQVGNHIDTYEAMLNAYNQLNAPVGQFGHDSEIVSTNAAESSSPGDAVYQGFDQQLADCQAQRSPVAAAMNADLNAAMFNNANIDPGAWSNLITQAQALIGDMHSLSQMSTPPSQLVCG
jgi:hypothetical protein